MPNQSENWALNQLAKMGYRDPLESTQPLDPKFDYTLDIPDHEIPGYLGPRWRWPVLLFTVVMAAFLAWLLFCVPYGGWR